MLSKSILMPNSILQFFVKKKKKKKGLFEKYRILSVTYHVDMLNTSKYLKNWPIFDIDQNKEDALGQRQPLVGDDYNWVKI